MVMDVESAQRSRGASRFDKSLSVLVGLAAVSAALLGTLEIDSNKRQEQAQAHSSRLAIEIFGRIAGSGPAADAGLIAGQAADLRDLYATARGLESLSRPATAGFETPLSDADTRTAADLRTLAAAVAAPLEPSSGVDPVARSVIASTPQDITALVQRQGRLISAANRFGTKGSRSVFALSTLALGAVLFGLSAVLGADNHGGVTLALGALALLVAGAWGASALLI